MELKNLYDTILERKKEKAENSYTCYLFEKGLDKILKKIGEESSEVIIAAKGDDGEAIKEEICDLLYHLVVLMIEKNITLDEIDEILKGRGQKTGNLKTFHKVDNNS